MPETASKKASANPSRDVAQMNGVAQTSPTTTHNTDTIGSRRAGAAPRPRRAPAATAGAGGRHEAAPRRTAAVAVRVQEADGERRQHREAQQHHDDADDALDVEKRIRGCVGAEHHSTSSTCAVDQEHDEVVVRLDHEVVVRDQHSSPRTMPPMVVPGGSSSSSTARRRRRGAAVSDRDRLDRLGCAAPQRMHAHHVPCRMWSSSADSVTCCGDTAMSMVRALDQLGVGRRLISDTTRGRPAASPASPRGCSPRRRWSGAVDVGLVDVLLAQQVLVGAVADQHDRVRQRLGARGGALGERSSTFTL